MAGMEVTESESLGMTGQQRQLINRAWILLPLIAIVVTGCRIDERASRARTQERLLADGSWETFSSVYHPGEGHAIDFLSIGLVVRRGGRLNESWAVREPDVLEISPFRGLPRKYRWFEPHNVLAHCHTGFGKPFLIAPDSLDYRQVIDAAREAGVEDCNARAVLLIAGAEFELSEDSTASIESADLSGMELDWALRTAIRDLRSVSRLVLAGTNLQDGDLSYLLGLRELEELDISDTEIGDEGLSLLPRLETLRLLDVSRTRVTDAGVRQLEIDLPYLEILRSPIG